MGLETKKATNNWIWIRRFLRDYGFGCKDLVGSKIGILSELYLDRAVFRFIWGWGGGGTSITPWLLKL